MFSPWLFHPEHGAQAQGAARAKIRKRFALLDRHLADRAYLLGDRFTVADAYAFTIVRWSHPAGVDLDSFASLRAYQDRVAARPAVRAALAAEGLSEPVP